jgi:ABC-type multidrug transport system fused ATPase/permease subunit
MQEPILFNQSIKENILYGKQDATDLEVRRAALLANATSFIETNNEDLSKEDLLVKMKTDLQQKIN